MSKKKPAEIKREEAVASKLSTKSEVKPPKIRPFNYGLSITLDDKGHTLSPEGYIMAEEMLKYI